LCDGAFFWDSWLSESVVKSTSLRIIEAWFGQTVFRRPHPESRLEHTRVLDPLTGPLVLLVNRFIGSIR
jgi:hypothetical protein